jgi:hypothetical protein
MSSKLKNHLIDAYLGENNPITDKIAKDFAIQIDDQDDNDDITLFCNLFVRVRDKGNFVFDMIGNFPITKEINELVEIYDGEINTKIKRITLYLNISQIDVLIDLANHIKKTYNLGETINNPMWHRISARTISSIYRFVRLVKEYIKIQQRNL